VLRKVLEWFGLMPPKGEEWGEPKGELVIRPMTYEDLDEVVRIERMCFGWGAWSRGAFASELTDDDFVGALPTTRWRTTRPLSQRGTRK